ncbi:MAG: hypothetical protein AAGD96_36095, partial [Chloroflexota bacterium]
SPAAAAHAPAVRLFIDRAERLGAAFLQDEHTLDIITKICRMVGGNALAIELAAVWMRQMSAAEILEAVQESIDFLEARHSDIPARHRSMRAVFDQTWQLLPADAQQTLAQLSVFRGGFGAKAAQEIVQTNRKMLALLHDRSLIHRLTSGRYEMRPLVREYAAERFEMLGMIKEYAADQLDEDQAKITLQSHARWFLKFLADQKSDLMGAKPWDAIERIEIEIENVRQAWQSGLEEVEANANALLSAAEPLSEYYNIRGRFQEADEMFSLAAKIPTHRIPNTDRLVAHATMHKTRFIVRLGQYKDGAELGKQSVRLAKAIDDNWCAAMGHVWWCQAYWEQGLTQEALDVLEKGEAYRDKAGDEYLNGRFNHQYSVCYSIQGYSARALEHSQAAIKLFTSTKSLLHRAISLNSLGAIHFERQEFLDAKKIYTSIIDLIEPKFMPAFIAMVYFNLSNSLQQIGEMEDAANLLNQSLHVYENMGLQSRELYVYYGLASLSFKYGDFDNAQIYASKSKSLSAKFRNFRLETDSILTLGDIALEK